MLVAMAFGTGLVQAPAGTAMLTACPIVLGFLLGSSRLSLQLAGSYVALRVLHHLCLLGRTCRWYRGSESCWPSRSTVSRRSPWVWWSSPGCR